MQVYRMAERNIGIESLYERVHVRCADYRVSGTPDFTVKTTREDIKRERAQSAREEELEGRGVSYCAVCDGAFYAGKSVAVIGGGNSALQEAILLAERCSHVTVVQNLDDLTGEAKLADVLRAKPNVSFIYHTVVAGLAGEKELTGLRLRDAHTGAESDLAVDGMFVCIGLVPNNGAFASAAALDAHGYFAADETLSAGTPGVFVAGDCRAKSVRQITTAVSDGAVAALAA